MPPPQEQQNPVPASIPTHVAKKPIWKQIAWGVAWSVFILLVLLVIALGIVFFRGPRAVTNIQNNLRTADLAIIQADLELYKADTGKYPASLDQLSPKYLATVPVDSATQAPYQYQVGQNAGSYQLCAQADAGQQTCVSSETGINSPNSNAPIVAASSTASNESWSTYTFVSKISSVPNFTFTYPSSWGQPKVNEDASQPNDLTIELHPFSQAEFEQSQKVYPDALVTPLRDVRMDILLLPKTFTQFMAQSYPGTTKQNPSVGSLGSSRYIMIGQRNVFAVKMSLNTEDSDYVYELLNGSVLDISVTGDPKYKNDEDSSGNSTRDKIIESIKFASPSY